MNSNSALTRRLRALALLIVVALVAAACGGSDEEAEPVEEEEAVAETTTTTTTTEAPYAGPWAPLTGLPAEAALLEEAAIMVKISNNDSRSLAAQIGLETADIVIEERIEASSTRFAAIFHSTLPTELGPVRSARVTDLDLMRNLGTPLFLYSGGNATVRSGLNSLVSQGEAVTVTDDGRGYLVRNDVDFNRPDNFFVDLNVVRADLGDTAGQATPVLSFLDEGETNFSIPTDGVGVTVRGRNVVSFVHYPERGYVRVQDGVIHTTRVGQPLIFDNIVVMETQYVPSAADPASIDGISVGQGSVSVLVNGERFEGIWDRPTAADPYRFVGNDGIEILLTPGQTWITMVPSGSYEFAVDEATQMVVLGDLG